MTDRDLTIALCELLAEELGWSWSLTEPYPAGVVGLFYGSIGDTPDRAVGVRVYGGTDRDELHERRVQLRFRGARGVVDGADKLAAIAFAVLDGLPRVGGLNGIRRESMAPLGADTNDRAERTDNYVVVLDNEEAAT